MLFELDMGAAPVLRVTNVPDGRVVGLALGTLSQLEFRFTADAVFE